MKTVPMSYFYCGEAGSDRMIPCVLSEFADNGAENIVIGDFRCGTPFPSPRSAGR